MSSPALPRSAAPANPMRQQLDELDALLQRMLALPVNQLEEPVGGLEERTAAPADAVPPRSAGSATSAYAMPKLIVQTPAAQEILPKPRGPLVVLQPVSSPEVLTVSTPQPTSGEAAVALAEPPSDGGHDARLLNGCGGAALCIQSGGFSRRSRPGQVARRA